MLRGLLPGKHSLLVSAVDQAVNADPFPRQLQFVTSAGPVREAAPLVLVDKPGNNSAIGTFRFSGWKKNHFEWRLGSGPWIEAVGTPNITVSASPGRPHFLEARPLGADGLQSAPPVRAQWSVLEGASALSLLQLEDGPHHLVVKAIDAVGNIDSHNKSWVWVVDTTPPAGCIVFPTFGGSTYTCLNDSFIPASRCELNVTGDGEAIARVLTQLDGGATESWNVPAGGSDAASNSVLVSIDAAEGDHVLTVGVEDAAGNERACALWRWTYDPNPPRAWLMGTEGLPVATALDATTFLIGRNRMDVSVWWALDGGTWRNTSSNRLVDTVDVPAGHGVHTLALRAKDAFGNGGENRSAWSWTVDLQPPSSVVHGPSSPHPQENATFSLLCATMAVGTNLTDCMSFHYVVFKDGSSCAFASGTVRAGGFRTTSFRLTDLDSGVFVASVTAEDHVGNLQLIPTNFSWNVSLPVILLGVKITSGPPEQYGLSTATLYFYAHQDGRRLVTGVLFQVKLNEAAWSLDDNLRCSSVGLCSFTVATAAPMVYRFQVGK